MEHLQTLNLHYKDIEKDYNDWYSSNTIEEFEVRWSDMKNKNSLSYIYSAAPKGKKRKKRKKEMTNYFSLSLSLTEHTRVPDFLLLGM